MGNWRTVHVVGTCDPADVEAVRAHLTVDRETYGNFGPLSIGQGLCGLGDWPAEHIDVSDALWPLVNIAPSLRLKVHCGGDHESHECVATIHVEDGQVFEGPPEIEHVRGVSEDAMAGRLFKAITRPREQVEQPPRAEVDPRSGWKDPTSSSGRSC